MKAYTVSGPGESVEEMELPTPELKGREVLVNITHTGVCHSDVHMQEGYFDLGAAGKLPVTASGVEYPAVFGHEIVGTVKAVGPDSSLQPGDQQYIVFPWIGCGECQACREDRENYCPRPRNLSVALKGGYAHEAWVPDEKYLIELGDLDPAWGATLACSGVTSYSAVNKVLPRGDEDIVAVIGAGGVGLMAVAMLKALGHKQIAAVDVSDENLESAKQLGATITFNSRVENPLEGLLEATGKKIAAAIDFVNNAGTASMALGALQKGGKLVSVGLFGGEHTYPTSLLALQVFTIEGNFVGSLPELKELVELAKTNDLPKLPIEEKPLTVENINSSLEALAAGKSRGRTVLVA
ncbi:alcohol dehydrogenase [Brevibacterium daeguense]|uniref:alcohol dehydrogenase n=1 Tax=Brevibacterium daeguense TaxID=909936 RepID=A0ABP8EK87_9MICO|nr:alcohol dehydrogenase [Brevibacterium daeguense]